MKQSEKIITLMSGNRRRKWWFPPHFMQDSLGDLFVGYEASARFSELARDYPDMFQSTKLDKYLYRRIRWEDMNGWLPTLPANLRDIIEADNDKLRA